MMSRSLYHRYELLAKVTEPSIRKRILKHLNWYLDDTENARIIDKGYEYHINETKKKDERVDCQALMRREAKKMATEG